jgi:hypothetical protein
LTLAIGVDKDAPERAERLKIGRVSLARMGMVDDIERIFGYGPRSTQEKLRVAEALEQLPRLSRSLETGALSWCAARELTRVAVAATEQAWLDAAQGKTTRRDRGTGGRKKSR